MSALLEASKVRKAFGGMAAVDDVDLALEAGYVTGIIGPNGAGKTTLVHLLTGHILPDSGRVTFDGTDITQLASHERVRRSLCRTFQVVDVFPRLTVFENVQLAIITRQGRNMRFISPAAREARDQVELVLNEVGMWPFRERRAEQLSHGQQRRLDLAISLATEPKLFFLDEPTSGVSPKERNQILELIRELADKKRTTFVLIEHDMEVVFDLCQRVVAMHRGKVLADGAPEEIKGNKDVIEVYLGDEV